MRTLLAYLLLPTEISRFERDYLAKMTRIGLLFLYAHLPVMVVVALLAGTSPVRAGLYTIAALVGPTLAYRFFDNPRQITRAYAFTAMCLGGLLVHFGQGPMQIEMHFHFFVLIALLAVYGDPLVIIVAAVTVALHHLVLWFALPSSVFNYDAPVWAVLVHALFVVVESVAACFVARSFFDNVIGLERIVRRRTDELARRTEQMTLVLDNVQQGLAIVQPDGTLCAERSAILAKHLGQPEPGESLWRYVGRVQPEVGQWLEIGWQMLDEGALPVEVALDQLPKRITHGGRILALSYQPLPSRDGFAGALFVVTDITSEVERERYESEQREVLALFERFLKDRIGLLEFAAEAGEIVTTLMDEDVAVHVQKRLLHTLKGNAAIFGCGSVARLCHDIESRFEESGHMLSTDRVELRVAWDHVEQKLSFLFGDRNATSLEIDASEHEAVLRALHDGSSPARVARMLEDWRLEPTALRLARLAEHARALAHRLGKGAIDVDIEANGVRLAPEGLRSFWAALMHVLRNAIDHGLEAPDEREARGKARQGRIGLRTRLTHDHLVVELSDDGRGIAWEAVREKARAKGLLAETQADLVDAILSDGVSTKDVANEYSGRGVGMAVIRAECEKLSGVITVGSTAHMGTTVRVALPRRVLTASSPQDLRTRPSRPVESVSGDDHTSHRGER